MHHLGGQHIVSEQFDRAAGLDLHDLERKPPLIGGSLRKEHFHRCFEPRARRGRAGDQQRTRALLQELLVDQQEPQAAEMITMQVRQDYGVDAAELEAATLERHWRGGTAIEHQGRLAGLYPEAGIEPPSGAEGIAGANNRQSHGQALALGRVETAACQRRTLVQVSGTVSLAGFKKSTATRPVISATLYPSPAANGRSLSARSRISRNCMMRGLLASAQAGTCGTSISRMAGWVLRNTWAIGNSRLSSIRLFHISTSAMALGPTPNNGGSGWIASK